MTYDIVVRKNTKLLFIINLYKSLPFLLLNIRRIRGSFLHMSWVHILAWSREINNFPKASLAPTRLNIYMHVWNLSCLSSKCSGKMLTCVVYTEWWKSYIVHSYIVTKLLQSYIVTKLHSTLHSTFYNINLSNYFTMSEPPLC